MKIFHEPEIDINTISGLSEAEAAQRLKTEGYNEIPSTKRRSVFAIAFEVIREPMFLRNKGTSP